ncbi:MAG: ABC transporter ATP-binding protein/permease, partial [Lachnospiraceae bacterium]|nr:ABC transporter ATP-binding protein/permease [Lachnospiraceae bacterium]
QKRSMIILLFAIFIGAVLELLGVSLFMPLTTIVTDPGKIETNFFLRSFRDIFSLNDATSMFTGLAFAIILIYVAKNTYLSLMYYFLYGFIYHNQLKVESRLVDCYMKKPYIYHLDHNTSDMIRNIMLDSERLFQLILQFLSLISEVLISLFLVLYLLIQDPVMTVSIAAVLAVSVGLFMLLTRKRANRYGLINQEYDGRMHQAIEEALGAVKDIKILHREQYFVDKFTHGGEQKMDALIHTNFFGAVPKYLIEMVCMAGILAVMIAKVMSGTDMNSIVPELAAFAVAAFKLLPSVGKITNYSNGISFLMPSIDLIYHDLKETEDMLKVEEVDESDAPDISEAEAISVEKVSFAYPNTDKNVMDDVSFRIPSGSSVGLIGPTGAGKTTVADVILGIFFPKSGEIKYGKMNVHRYPMTWAKRLAYIPQAIFLSDESIRENIAFGIERDEIDDGRVWEAIKEAQLTDFVRSLPGGLDTKVGERGVRLSGGQRQRIGIARALYGEPEILVLDEATAALDTDTEKAVMEAIDSLHGRKTLLIIAHRLTTIRNCDIILEVRDGKVSPVRREEFDKMLKEQTDNE